MSDVNEQRKDADKAVSAEHEIDTDLVAVARTLGVEWTDRAAKDGQKDSENEAEAEQDPGEPGESEDDAEKASDPTPSGDEPAVEEEIEPSESDGKLPESVQRAIDKRIGKEVAKRKGAEEALDLAREKVAQLERRLSEREKPESRDDGARDLWSLTPDELEERDRSIRKFEKWALENWEGYESDDGGYDAKAIRRRYAELRDERETEIPRVRAAHAERRQWDETARNVYPALFDSGSQERAFLDRMLAENPGLRKYPQITMMVGDLIAGGRARMDAAKKKSEPQKSAPAAPPVPKAAAAKPRAEKQKKQEKKIDVAKVAERGGSASALAGALREMLED